MAQSGNCYRNSSSHRDVDLDFISAFSPKYVVDLFESLSVLNHFDSIERGVLTIGNVWFFAVMIIAWLFGNIILLNENKAN